MNQNTSLATAWRHYTEYHAGRPHTVTGDLRVLPHLYSPQLGNQRDILVYLPPSYPYGDWRYPVLYMHDGQNLFDAHTSFAGEWQVDETVQALSREGVEAIVVGIPNTGRERINEYSPFVDALNGGGKGDGYLAFITDTVKPLVDAEFRTLRHRNFTGLLGSSMGGLISLYGFFSRPDAFGLAGVMSPALWFANQAVFRYVKQAEFSPGKIYLDAGPREYAGAAGSKKQRRTKSGRYSGSVRDMSELLAGKGYQPGASLKFVEETDAQHEEAAWARRLPDALRYLLRP
ncbi:MAG: hypothetical protein Kow0031_32790 [Anaerolineae bacterium]